MSCAALNIITYAKLLHRPSNLKKYKNYNTHIFRHRKTPVTSKNKTFQEQKKIFVMTIMDMQNSK